MSESKESGMVVVVLAREKPNGKLKAMISLLDFWKRGIRDVFVLGDISKEELKKECAKLGNYKFTEINFDEGKKLVRRGYLIAKSVKTELPWEYQRWESMLGNLASIPDSQGSLYKCAKCGGELPEYIVELMTEHAQLDEYQFYMVCKKCGGDFEE
jgi:DNA-directed RNA polymerase subunit RPC12/RpoP